MSRLWVKPSDVPKAGRKTLIRSLKTTDHSEALKRYGAASIALEQELQALLAGDGLRTRVEQHREGVVRPCETVLTPSELTAIALGDFNPNDKTHLFVNASFSSGKELPITWQEALDLHIKVSNRNRPQPRAKSSIYKYKHAVNFFSPDSDPYNTTFDIIRQWIEDHDQDCDPVSVAQRFRWLSVIHASCMVEGKIQSQNSFN